MPVMTWLIAYLRKYPVVALAVVLLVGMSVSLWNVSSLSARLSEALALQHAGHVSSALSEFRTLYTAAVVARVRPHGIEVTHDYEQKEGAIPLPATMSMELGRRMSENGSGGVVRLYSQYPFPWRKDGGPTDAFERDAIQALTEQPDQPFFRFERSGAVSDVLRYATADIMRPTCVECHNTHPDSPKKDWQVGDVRGVLEVTIPMGHAMVEERSGMAATLALMAATTFIGLLLVGFATRSFRRSSEESERGNRALQSEIKTRTEAERTLSDKLTLLEEQGRVLKQQHDAIQALSTPIVEVWDGVLALPLIGVVDSSRSAQITENLFSEISRSRSRVAILDLTGVRTVDVNIAANLLQIVRGVELLGSLCLVSGISAELARAMTTEGVEMRNVSTFRTLAEALRYAIQPAPHRTGPRSGA